MWTNLSSIKSFLSSCTPCFFLFKAESRNLTLWSFSAYHRDLVLARSLSSFFSSTHLLFCFSAVIVLKNSCCPSLLLTHFLKPRLLFKKKYLPRIWALSIQNLAGSGSAVLQTNPWEAAFWMNSRHRMLAWVTQTTKRQPALGVCGILPLSYYTRALECQKNGAKKLRLPSVAPSLACGAQGCGFEPQRRRIQNV